jgi:hypothetical protein
MAEPRFKKKIEGTGSGAGGDPRFKKSVEGSKKRRRAEEKPSECPCGNQPCKGCGGANVISPEKLLSDPEKPENVCLEPTCEENCPGCPAGLKA